MKISTKWLLGCLMIALVAPIVSADLYYETKVTGGPGRETPDLTKTYLSDQGMRIETGDGTAMVVNFKEEKFYQINLNDKTYTETKFEDFMKPQDEKDAELTAQMGKMMEQMMASMEVTKTEETQEIKGYNCTKYLVSIMGSTSDYWVTKDVKEYDVMMKQTDQYKELFKKNPILSGISAGFDMQKKIDGFPIRIINKMMGMEIVQEVEKIETEKIDKDVFQPPKEFNKVEKSADSPF